MDTEQMIERARHIVRDGAWGSDQQFRVVEDFAAALLAEHERANFLDRAWQVQHDARVAAERERDEAQLAAAGQVLLTNREARRGAALEAALRNAPVVLREVANYLHGKTRMWALDEADRLDAALGDDAAPTEPPKVDPVLNLLEAGRIVGLDPREMLASALDDLAEPIHRSIGKVYEPNGWGDCEACGLTWPCPSAPKAAPEPERSDDDPPEWFIKAMTCVVCGRDIAYCPHASGQTEQMRQARHEDTMFNHGPEPERCPSGKTERHWEPGFGECQHPSHRSAPPVEGEQP
jgi:hypothetical protein